MREQLSAFGNGLGGDELPQRQPLNVLGLFAGIGGIEVGLKRASHRTVEVCEVDDGAAAVLEEHFGDINPVSDVSRLTEIRPEIDLITAGFPCQDLSQAGKTLGIDGSKSGLIGHVFRLLRHARKVEWLLFENVPFMLRLGRGKALDVILSNLEQLGYRWAYRIVDTRAFGLPQRRKRVFIVASLQHDPCAVLLSDNVEAPPEQFEPRGMACGFYWTEGSRGLGWAVNAVPTLKGGSTVGIPSPPGVWFPDVGIVRPGIRDAERLQGFEPGWTQPAEKKVRASMRWKLVGNAVSVPVAEWIGRRLRQPRAYISQGDAPLKEGTSWPDAAYNVGNGRFVSGATTFPCRREAPDLAQFLDLNELEPLSYRATAGFLGRFESSSLRKPEGFLEALRAHRNRTAASAA